MGHDPDNVRWWCKTWVSVVFSLPAHLVSLLISSSRSDIGDLELVDRLSNGKVDLTFGR